MIPAVILVVVLACLTYYYRSALIWMDKACTKIDQERSELTNKLAFKRQEADSLRAKVEELSRCDHAAVEKLQHQLAAIGRENQRLVEALTEERARASHLEAIVAGFHDLATKVARPAPRQATPGSSVKA